MDASNDMKKLIGSFILLLAALPALAQEAFDTGILYRRTDNLATNTRWLTPASPGTVKFIISNGNFDPNPLPDMATLGTGLVFNSGVIALANPPVNPDWNASSGLAQILNKPSIPASQINSDWAAVSGAAQIMNKPTIPASQVQSDWAAPSGISAILNKPTVPPATTLTTTGTGAATYNSGTGALNIPTPSGSGTVTSITAGTGLSGGAITTSGTISLPNTGTAGSYNNVTTDAQGRVTAGSNVKFDFSQPTARTLASSTSYQALDTTKAAIVYPSYSCQNATQLLVSSACTIQVRMGTGALTCSTGTVYYTQSLTVGLGLLLTQNSTNPVPINVPIGGSFILCPQAGTFTTTTIEQSAG
jgi:hypothetical protein